MTVSKSVARKPRRSYHHGNLRRALLDEALATIRAEGVDGLTLREIGARVGVSRTALYRHFADKRALLIAVATEGFAALRAGLVSAWDGGGHGTPGFEAMGHAYVHFAVTNPSHYRVMFSGFVHLEAAEDPELCAESEGAFLALVGAIVAQQRDGLVRDDDPVLMARYVWALVHGVALLAIDRQLDGPEADGAMTRYALGRLLASLAR